MEDMEHKFDATAAEEKFLNLVFGIIKFWLSVFMKDYVKNHCLLAVYIYY